MAVGRIGLADPFVDPFEADPQGRPLEVERTGNRREDVRALARAMAKGFEDAIAASPTDWHMFQAGWDP